MPAGSLPIPGRGPGQGPVQSPPGAKQVSKADKDKEQQETLAFTPGTVDFEYALRMWRDGRKYVDTSLRIRWDRYYRVYSGERVDPSYFGSVKVNNREAHSIIETLVANIAGGNPSFSFIPTTEEQNTDTSMVNQIVRYYMEWNRMDLKNQLWVRDMLMYGTGVLHVAWQDGKAYIENIPIRDFFADPTSSDLERTQKRARYAGFEYLASKDDLEAAMVYDPNKKKMVLKYQLDGIGDSPVTSAENIGMDKQFKDMFNGSTLDQADAVQRQVHVIRIYDLVSGKVMEIGNQRKFIYYADTVLQRQAESRPGQPMVVDGVSVPTTQHLDEIAPFLPFAILRDYQDSSLFYGEGEMAILMGDAELLNDYEAMDADNAAYQNMPMYTIDPAFADMANEIETISGAIYPIPKGALNPVVLAQTGEAITLKKQEVIQRMRSGTAADQAVQGVGQERGRTTATEVTSQLDMAGNRFSTKLTNLASGGYAQLASVIFRMMQIFLTPDQSVRMITQKGIEFARFDPWEWNGEYEPTVKLDQQIKQHQLEVDMKNNQLFAAIDQTPPGILDPVQVARFKVQHIDPNFTDADFNQLVAQPVPPPPKDPREFIQLDKIFPNATPFTQNNILKMAGLPEDPELVAQVQTNMHEQAGRRADILDPSTDNNGKPLPLIAAALGAQGNGAPGAEPGAPEGQPQLGH